MTPRHKTLDGKVMPTEEWSLIRSVVRALSAATLSDVEGRVYLDPKRRVPPDKDVAADRVPTEIQRKMLADTDIAREQWSEYWLTEQRDYRDAFRYLTQHKRLHEDDLHWLVPAVETGVVCKPQIEVKAGRASITTPLRFWRPGAAVAYALLKLSSMPDGFVMCEECEGVDLVTPHVGRKSERFCSTTCRNRWHKRAQRARDKGRAAAKHK